VSFQIAAGHLSLLASPLAATMAKIVLDGTAVNFYNKTY
jgi:hypothetical protein